METTTRTNSLQTYQVILYERALHPEFFELQDRRVERLNGYEFEAWLTAGGHVLRFELDKLCAANCSPTRTAACRTRASSRPSFAPGERDFDHTFPTAPLNYITTVQTETLAENLYISTFEELLAFGRDAKAMIHVWEDDSGRCLSMLDTQRHSDEIHIQAYHLLANQGIVLRSQTIFEQRS